MSKFPREKSEEFAEENRMVRKIDQSLIDDMHKWSQIIASQSIGSSRKALFFAEETVSDLLIKLTRNLNKDYEKESKKITNDFVFISLKHTFINTLKKYNETRKRESFNDFGNVQIGADLGDMFLELEDESINDLREKIEKENDINLKVDIIVTAMLKNEWIDKMDINIFTSHYLEGMTFKEIRTKYNLAGNYVYLRNKRIKSVLKYLYAYDLDPKTNKEKWLK